MKHTPQKIDESRRRLLATSLCLGAVGAGVGALGLGVVARGVATRAPEVKQPSVGYHETEHIRSYYDTAA